MCKSEIPAVSVSATTKTLFSSVQRLRSAPPPNSVLSLSYNGCMKKNKTRCNGSSQNGPRRFIVNYQFAQRMYVRTSAEFTLEKERRVFALFAYEYRPESNFLHRLQRQPRRRRRHRADRIHQNRTPIENGSVLVVSGNSRQYGEYAFQLTVTSKRTLVTGNS